MSYERLAYDDADTAVQMHDDCTECGTHLSLPRQRTDGVFATDRAHADTGRTGSELTEAAASLASRPFLPVE